MRKYIYFFFLLPVIVFGQEYNRNILIEVLTNSHCPLCPAAHNTINSYLSTGQNSTRLRTIYYHMNFPYPDDQLNIANPVDASARNSFYGPFSATPVTFFDGQNTPGSYSQWSSAIDSRLNVKSPIQIKLTGSYSPTSISIDADLNVSTSFIANDLTIQFIVVENVNYLGRNGISDHKNTMRKIAGSTSGKSISASTQKMNMVIPLSSTWQKENLSVVVFVQKTSTKEVIQSEYISYNSLVLTSVKGQNEIPAGFKLFQNYPNPFNPQTFIGYSIPVKSHVSLKIYDVLGKEIAELIDEVQQPGIYNSKFTIPNSHFSSGVYFYTLNAGSFLETKKFILIK